MNNKIYINIGFQTYEHKDYQYLQNKLNRLENNQEKLRYLEENNIAFYWEEEQEKIEEIKEKYYYNITFEVVELI